MELADKIFEKLNSAAAQIRADLWLPSDIPALKVLAGRLADLKYEFDKCATDDEKSECIETGVIIVQQIRGTVQSRLNVHENSNSTQLVGRFVKTLAESLNPILGIIVDNIVDRLG